MRDERSDDPRPEDDQEAIDRAFAELIADFHRPSHPSHETGGDPDGDPAEDAPPHNHPARPPQPPRPVYGFRLDWDAPLAPQPGQGRPNDRGQPAHPWRASEPPEPSEEDERYIPPPAPPLTRPAPRTLVGWMAIIYAIVAMILLAVGVPLPSWVGWLAVMAFLGGLALLFSQLPRHRPPDDDDGARL